MVLPCSSLKKQKNKPKIKSKFVNGRLEKVFCLNCVPFRPKSSQADLKDGKRIPNSEKVLENISLIQDCKLHF